MNMARKTFFPQVVFSLAIFSLLFFAVTIAVQGQQETESRNPFEAIVGAEVRNIIEVPVIKNLFGNERMVFTADDNGKKYTYGVVLKNGEIESFEKGEIENATVTVTTTRQALEKISASENKEQAVAQALGSEEIQYSIDLSQRTQKPVFTEILGKIFAGEIKTCSVGNANGYINANGYTTSFAQALKQANAAKYSPDAGCYRKQLSEYRAFWEKNPYVIPLKPEKLPRTGIQWNAKNILESGYRAGKAFVSAWGKKIEY